MGAQPMLLHPGRENLQVEDTPRTGRRARAFPALAVSAAVEQVHVYPAAASARVIRRAGPGARHTVDEGDVARWSGGRNSIRQNNRTPRRAPVKSPRRCGPPRCLPSSPRRERPRHGRAVNASDLSFFSISGDLRVIAVGAVARSIMAWPPPEGADGPGPWRRQRPLEHRRASSRRPAAISASPRWLRITGSPARACTRWPARPAPRPRGSSCWEQAQPVTSRIGAVIRLTHARASWARLCADSIGTAALGKVFQCNSGHRRAVAGPESTCAWW